MPKPEDNQTSTVDGAAAYERWRSIDEPHNPNCRCPDCVYDDFDPSDA